MATWLILEQFPHAYIRKSNVRLTERLACYASALSKLNKVIQNQGVSFLHDLWGLGLCLQGIVSKMCRRRRLSTWVLTIHCNKGTVYLLQPLKTILQGFCNVMTGPQRCVLFHEYINLYADAVTSMVDLDALETLNKWCKAVRHEHHLALCAGIGSLSGKTSNVFKTGACPVVDDVQGKASSTDRIEPPDIDLGTNKGKQKRQGIKINICSG